LFINIIVGNGNILLTISKYSHDSILFIFSKIEVLVKLRPVDDDSGIVYVTVVLAAVVHGGVAHNAVTHAGVVYTAVVHANLLKLLLFM
jgi:hypothetical protein